VERGCVRVLGHDHGQLRRRRNWSGKSGVDLIVFGLGAVVAFGGLEGLASGGFRTPLQKGSDEVVLLGTSLAFISIILAIATARGVAAVLTGAWAWFGGALCASLVFALIESLELMLAEWVQERRGEPLDADE
jgi:xanthine/uracil permease